MNANLRTAVDLKQVLPGLKTVLRTLAKGFFLRTAVGLSFGNRGLCQRI